MKPGDGVEWAEFPTDPEEIKKHIRVRRQAVAILLAEMTALNQSLQQKVGIAEFLMFKAEEKQSADTDIMGAAQQKEKKDSESDDRDS